MPSYERIRWAEFRISAVVFSALMILGVLIYLLSGGTWLKPKTYLVTYLPDSTGLDRGADVQLNGVQIGKVVSLHLTNSKDPNRVVEVRLKIEQEYLKNIPDDSTADLDSANLLGDKYLNITMGKSPQPLRPGEEVQFKPPTTFVQNMDLAQFETQLRTIDQTIQDIQAGKGFLGQFVVSDALYSQFLTGIEDVEKKLRAAATTESQLGQFLYSATAYDSITASLKQLDSRLAEFQTSPLLRDSSQYDQIRDQIASVRSTLADLKAGKGAAGRLFATDATYVDLNRQLASFIGAVDALNYGQGSVGQMLSNAQMYESLNESLKQFGATVKDFREHPQKYLRLKVF